MKKASLVLLLIFCSIKVSNASHLNGGEITWVCQGNGQYIFTLKIYRDCSGIPLSCQDAQQIDVSGLPGLCAIPLPTVSGPNCVSTDIGPTNCLSCSSGSPLSMEEWKWISNPVTLTGVPPATGWTFSWNSCCRNVLQNLSGGGFTIRSIMYPYNGQNADPCFDSSPQFLETPDYLFCTGYTQTMNHGCIDFENDSLVYSFATCLDQPSSTCPNFTAANLPYNNGYTVNSPLPGSSVINYKTGVLSMQNASTIGNFATCIKVTSYKCGIKVAEVYRDYITMFSSNCALVAPAGSNNSSPDVPPVFTTGFDTTVCAGDTLRFILRASDFEGTPPVPGSPQSVKISANSQQFGLGYTDPTQGCLTPPCATLNKVLPSTSMILNLVELTWVTTQNHVANSTNCFPGYYCFNFDFTDNFCPIPATESVSVCVTVENCNVNIQNFQKQNFYAFYKEGNIIINLTDAFFPHTYFTLSDITGKNLMLAPIYSRENIFQISGTAKGVYLVTLSNENFRLSKKVVIF